MIWKKRENDRQRVPLSRLLILALLFFAGVILGQVFAGRVPDSTGDELGHYLTDYVRISGEAEQNVGTIFSAAVIYLRYPLLAFLLGFTSLGLLLVPCLTVTYGFFLSFSVCCFTAAFGADGVLLALAVFGLRCAVTMPCYFLLAVPSWGTSAALASLSFGNGRRIAPVTYDKTCWLCFGSVILVLLAGMCVDLFLAPWFLQMILERILS